jgi:hypothetical protein
VVAGRWVCLFVEQNNFSAFEGIMDKGSLKVPAGKGGVTMSGSTGARENPVVRVVGDKSEGCTIELGRQESADCIDLEKGTGDEFCSKQRFEE